MKWKKKLHLWRDEVPVTRIHPGWVTEDRKAFTTVRDTCKGFQQLTCQTGHRVLQSHGWPEGHSQWVTPLPRTTRMGHMDCLQMSPRCFPIFLWHYDVSEATAKFGNVQKTPSLQMCWDAERCEWEGALKLLIFLSRTAGRLPRETGKVSEPRQQCWLSTDHPVINCWSREKSPVWMWSF